MPELTKKEPRCETFWVPRALGCGKLMKTLQKKLAKEKGVSRVLIGDALKHALEVAIAQGGKGEEE